MKNPIAVLVAILAAVFCAPRFSAAVDFEKEIKPLLRDRCVTCHGPLKQEGKLRLDAGRLVLKGGTEAIVSPGKSHDSELVRRILAEDEDSRMPPEGARLTAVQVDLLKRWIDEGAIVPPSEVIVTAPNEHWSFQPIRRPEVPTVKDQAWVRNPIDNFILARLESKGETPQPQASATALLRRSYLDIIGLPPTIEEQEQFQKSSDLKAVVQDLLSRPEYGERWARHWLDVVRYADSNGYERDAEKPFVWRYRDYVIQALNADKPFDRFVMEQIAGDELLDRSIETLIATGFLRLGHWDDEPADPPTDRFDQLDDIVSTCGQAFLGLTIGCARCHDHKFEPLSSRDYYSLVAVFSPLQRPVNGRTDMAMNVEGTDVYAWRETSPQAAPTHILKRGSASNPGDPVEPAVPVILAANQPKFPEPGATSTMRRFGLARWITSTDNPLTARVIVNRIWQQHFGQGLVGTANDFGLRGTPPLNPELLDWLAAWFMQDAGWSLKKLHTLILDSRTWQTVKSPEAIIQYRRLEVEAIRDSMLMVSGRLNSKRFGPAMKPPIPLSVIEANSDKQKIWESSNEEETSRRTIYAFIKRSMVVPMFETLDLADTVSSCPQRQITTVAPQALCLFNGDLTNQQARYFAARLQREVGTDPSQQIRHAFRLALSREPTSREQELMTSFLQRESLEQLCRVILNLNEFVYPE